MPSVFLSHSHRDKEVVRRIAHELRREHRIDVWFDEWSLLPGDSLREKIESAIEDSDYLVVFLSRYSVESAWVQRELTQGLVRELEKKNVVVVPVLLGRLPNSDIPLSLRDKVYVDLRSARDTRYQKEITKLIRRLRSARYASAKHRFDIPGLHFVEQLTFHPSGQLLAWFSGDGWASILDLTSFEVVSDIPGYRARSPNYQVEGNNPIQFTPDGDLFAIGHDDGYGNGDGRIEVFNWRDRHLVTVFQGPKVGVTDLCIDPSGQYLIGTFNDTCTKVWDLKTREEVTELDDSGWLAATHGCDRVAITSLKSRALRVFGLGQEKSLDLGPASFAASFSPDGSRIAAASGDDSSGVPGADIRIWSLPEGTPIYPRRPRFPEFEEISYDRWDSMYELWRLSFSPDGKDLGLVFNCGAGVYEIETGRVVFIVEDDSFNYVPHVAFDPTGHWIAVGDVNPPLYLWNRKNERIELILDGGSGDNDSPSVVLSRM